MKKVIAGLSLLLVYSLTLIPNTVLASEKKHIAFIAGKQSHLFGEHEFNAGGEIIVQALNDSGLVEAQLYRDGWPQAGFEKTPDAVVMYSDGLGSHVALDHLQALDELANKGVGVMAMHFAVHLEVGEASKAFTKFIGGYYESLYSTNPHWRANLKLNQDHPTSRGVKDFKVLDELYFNIRFDENNASLTPLITGTPPDSAREHVPHAARTLFLFGDVPEHIKENKGRTETLAWSIEREDGGRGLGFTGGHFHWNWAQADFRKFVLNSIVWVAGAEVPAQGINSQDPSIDELFEGQDEPPVPMVDTKEKVQKKFFDNNVEQNAIHREQGYHVPEDMFVLDDKLEVKLWAVSPQVYNPTNIDIDKDGRVWVAEGWNYRGMAKPRAEGDRIVVLEDTDGDGHADSSHTFVQDPELLVPLGVAVVDNKIIVSQPPHLIVYTDVDRDLVFDPQVDKRENLLTGFLGRDHDHSLHSVTVGPDGWYYANVGNMGANVVDQSGNTYYFGSSYNNLENAGKTSADGGVYIGGTAFRFPPDGSEIEVIGHNFRNSYEQAISSYGEVFQNDNDDYSGSRTAWLMEYANMGYASNDGKKTWPDFRRPGQSAEQAHWRQSDPGIVPSEDIYGAGAPTGIISYESTVLGEAYLGAVFSGESALNTIYQYGAMPEGSRYTLGQRKELITSNPNKEYSGIDGDIMNFRVLSAIKSGILSLSNKNASMLPQDFVVWLNESLSETKVASPQMFRPADLAVGPDGSIFIADWFDPRVGGHTAFDQDRQGAIYRIVPKGKKLSVPEIELNTIPGAIEALKSPAVNVRALGFYALKEKGESAYEATEALLKDKNPFVSIRALWLFPHMGEKGKAKLNDIIFSNKYSAQWKVTTLRALKRNDLLSTKHLEATANHPDPRVRAQTALYLRDYAWPEINNIANSLVKNFYTDRWYVEALGIGLKNKESQAYLSFSETWQTRPEDWSEIQSKIVWRLHPVEAMDALKSRATNPKLDPQQRIQALEAIAFIKDDKVPALIKEINAKASEEKFKVISEWWASNIDKLTSDESPASKAKELDISKALIIKGDIKRGEEIFKASPCLTCHKLNGEGGDLGPSLNQVLKDRDNAIKNIIQPISPIMPTAGALEYDEQDVADLMEYLQEQL